MTIAAIAASAAQTGGQGGTPRRQALPASRALVVTESAEPRARPAQTMTAPRITADAALVAHLWATRENLAQTRARRRAAPGTARSAYETADALRARPHPTRSRTV